MENLVDVKKVLLDESTDTGIVGQGFIALVASLKMHCRPLYAAVIYKWPSDMWNLWLKNKGDVLIKDHDSVSPSHQQAG